MQDTVFLALDCETTGLRADQDCIIEVGAVKFTLTDSLGKFESLFDPQVRIPAFVERLTGIRSEDLQGAPKFEQKRSELAEFCRDTVLIGHNLKFDLSFLASHGLDLRDRPSFDTQDLAGLILSRAGSLSLEALSDRLGLQPRSAHRALSDAETTSDLFLRLNKLAKNFPTKRWQEVDRLDIVEPSWLPRFIGLVSTHHPEPKESIAPDEKSTNEILNQKPDKTLIDTFKNLQKSALLETMIPAPQIAATLKYLGEPAILAVGQQYQAREIAKANNALLLLSPREYVSAEKITEFGERNLTPTETVFLSKLILHRPTNFFELNLTRAEYLLTESLAKENLTDYPLPVADHQLIVTDQTSLPILSEIVKSIGNRKIFITEAASLPENLARTKSCTLDLPTLELLSPDSTDKLTILWGMLGLLIREAKPKYGQVNFAEVSGLYNFQPARSAGLKFLESTRTKLPRRVSETLAIFFEAEDTDPNTVNYTRLLRSNQADEITIFLQAKPNSDQITELTEKFESVFFLDTALSTAESNFEFSRKRLGLPTDIPCKSLIDNAEKPLLTSIPDLPDPSNPSFADASRQKLIKLINSLTGITTVVFSGRYALSQFFEKAQTEAIHPLLAEKISGSPAKVKLKIDQADTVTYLTTKPQLPARTKNLILLRLPFAVRPDADWQTETLPSAVLAFKKLWTNLLSTPDRPTEQNFIVFDNRLTEKNYGQEFTRAIKTTVSIFLC